MGHGKALILERGHKMACALWLSHTHSEWSEENSSDAKPVFLVSINNSSPSLRSMLNPSKMHLLHLWVVTFVGCSASQFIWWLDPFFISVPRLPVSLTSLDLAAKDNAVA